MQFKRKEEYAAVVHLEFEDDVNILAICSWQNFYPGVHFLVNAIQKHCL